MLESEFQIGNSGYVLGLMCYLCPPSKVVPMSRSVQKTVR